MKTLLLSTICVLLSVASYAQESLGKGNTAMQEKKYAEAVKHYEAYFAEDASRYTSDTQTLFNLANASYKAGDFAKANKYCDKCVELKYKQDDAAYLKIGIAKKQKNQAAFEANMISFLKNYPDSKNHARVKSFLVKEYNKQASIPYNKGNEIAGAAPSEPQAFIGAMEKAIVKYEEASKLFDKTLAVSPNDPTAKNAKASIKAAKDNLKQYKAQLQ